jgi:CRISPR-associated protein Csm4
MSLWYARLTFYDRVHFGSLGVGLENTEEILHSDSLYSALCHAWSALFGAEDLAQLIARFHSAPPFVLSSAFPYMRETYFLPKPMSRAPGFEDENIRQEYGKEIKKTSYLSREIFTAWTRGEAFDPEKLSNDRVILTQLGTKELIPRVALGRENARSEIFHVGVVKFAVEAGLYILIRVEDETLLPRLRAALTLLGEMGVGGERTYGLGRFSVVLDHAGTEWAFAEDVGTPRYLTLSLFTPPPQELSHLGSNTAYALIERKGWIHSPYTYRQLKRKTVVMFTEGSVFEHPLPGQVLNVTPAAWDSTASHPIYRFAHPFYVSVH